MAHLVWLVAILSLAAFLAAAKTHGRQVRLEREQRGYNRVTFGTGTNPPWVEALWRRDRIRFWTLTPSIMALAGLVWALSDEPMARGRVGFGLIAILLWAPTLSFWILAILSLRRFQKDAQGPTSPQWRRAALRGTLAWLALCAATASATLATALT